MLTLIELHVILPKSIIEMIAVKETCRAILQKKIVKKIFKSFGEMNNCGGQHSIILQKNIEK